MSTSSALPWADDLENPQNWPFGKRWLITLLTSLYMLISPISSSIVAPALPVLRQEFHIPTALATQMMLSAFILASAIGPLIVSPLSEVYGRRSVLQLTTLFFLIFNMSCAFSQNAAQLLIFRFLAGIGGSAPAIGGGILADCWRPEERGKSLSFYYIFPLLGPALGPIIGGFIMRYSSWQWMFYSTSILAAAVQLYGHFAFPETYPPRIQRLRAMRLSKTGQTVNFNIYSDGQEMSLRKVLSQALIRPMKLLGTQVIVQILALYTAYIYGLMYLALSTFAAVWTNAYGQTDEIAGLNYISLGIGFTLGRQIITPVNDRVSDHTHMLERFANRLKLFRYILPLNHAMGVLVFPNTVHHC
jgi:multidrug resistance protein